MPLTRDQADDVWESPLFAETRSLYFGDLASTYSSRKQWITGASFFFSSGAAATIIAKMSSKVPIVLSLLVAVMTAYSVAINLDSKIRTMAKLHYAWNQIGNDYKRLWYHHYADDAETDLADIQRRETEISELATTDAPNDQKRMEHWQNQIFKLHLLETYAER